MIVVDTGPLIALFDPKDPAHVRCVDALKTIHDRLYTTLPVLTEAFHILQPDSVGSDRLRDFIVHGGISIWFFDDPQLLRAFELMEQYGDSSIDLADASLIVAAEALRTRTVFTIGRRDFRRYHIRRGHRHHAPEIIP